MKVLADLGKLNDGRNIIVLQKADRIEYVVAEGYNPDTESWGRGTYLYDLGDLARTILFVNETIGYTRLKEIAAKAIDGLREDDEEQAQIYCRDVIDMIPEELKEFGLEESSDDN